MSCPKGPGASDHFNPRVIHSSVTQVDRTAKSTSRNAQVFRHISTGGKPTHVQWAAIERSKEKESLWPLKVTGAKRVEMSADGRGDTSCRGSSVGVLQPGFLPTVRLSQIRTLRWTVRGTVLYATTVSLKQRDLLRHVFVLLYRATSEDISNSRVSFLVHVPMSNSNSTSVSRIETSQFPSRPQ